MAKSQCLMSINLKFGHMEVCVYDCIQMLKMIRLEDSPF